jgi:hypothetical protein
MADISADEQHDLVALLERMRDGLKRVRCNLEIQKDVA